jgi:hypothetical protein
LRDRLVSDLPSLVCAQRSRRIFRADTSLSRQEQREHQCLPRCIHTGIFLVRIAAPRGCRLCRRAQLGSVVRFRCAMSRHMQRPLGRTHSFPGIGVSPPSDSTPKLLRIADCRVVRYRLHATASPALPRAERPGSGSRIDPNPAPSNTLERVLCGSFGHELDPVANTQQRSWTACQIEHHGAGPSDQVPSTRGFERVDSSVSLRDADRTSRHSRARPVAAAAR